MAATSATLRTVLEQGEGAGLALPPLLVQAERIAATVILGVHGRRAAGPGETFWQYRAYGFGDSTQRIDWHRSAKADRVFIRENEWESANTLWLWANTGARMNFQSHLAATTKRERAQLLAMALASLASRAHERVGVLGQPRGAGYGRVALVRVAEALSTSGVDRLPGISGQQKRSAALLVSDFLEPLEDVRAALTAIAAQGVRGHVVQVCDPAEETLPWQGRVEYLGLDKPINYLAGKTEVLREAYQAAWTAHRDGLREICRRLGFSFTLHRTSEPPARTLLALHQQISERTGTGGAV
ncbi:MAG: DUF58 domain-containing protein [Hyphomicrobiales bacterium]